MFSLFPIHRPRVGVSFRTHGLDLVEIRRRWSPVPTVVRLVSRPLPADILKPTAAAPNVSDPAALVKELRALFDGVQDRAVAIDLPMACATLALFHFDRFPDVRAEQEALLRWRLRQDEHLTMSDLTLQWQAFPSPASPSTAVSVLLIAIRQTILDQYSRICDDADLIPVSMGFSTCHLLHFAHLAMPGTNGEAYFAHRTAETLIVLAFQHGRPQHLRIKPVRRVNIDLKMELLQTLHYFAQEGSHISPTSSRTTPLYLVDDESPATKQSSAPGQAEVWTLSEDPSWTLSLHRAAWATAPIVSTAAEPVHPPFATLASILAS